MGLQILAKAGGKESGALPLVQLPKEGIRRIVLSSTHAALPRSPDCLEHYTKDTK